MDVENVQPKVDYAAVLMDKNVTSEQTVQGESSIIEEFVSYFLMS